MFLEYGSTKPRTRSLVRHGLAGNVRCDNADTQRALWLFCAKICAEIGRA